MTATYEDTELDNSGNARPPNQIHRKSSSPSPLHSTATTPRRFRDGSPKMPSPYQSKKLGVSPSGSGDGSDLSIGKRLSGSHSSNSSLNDDDHDAYEPLSDFLREPPSSSESSLTSSVPPPQPHPQLQRGSISSDLPLGTSPPSYPAPVPPKQRGVAVERKISEAVNEEEEDDDDEGYTQVSLEDGQVTIDDFRGDEVERAPLPLLSSSTSARSSLAGDSAHSSPLRQSGTSDTSGGGGSMAGWGVGRSPSKMVSTSTGAKVALPPEPTSPPPSPPTDPRDPTPPIPISVKSPSPLLIQQNVAHDGSRSATPSTSEAWQEEQPKIPPKKRNMASLSSSVRETDEDIYAFDTLDPPTSKPSAPKQAATPLHGQTEGDDDIYAFDTLEKVPSTTVPAKVGGGGLPPWRVAPAAVATVAFFQPSYDDENIYEFDNLEDVAPVPVPEPKKPAVEPAKKKTGWTTSSQKPVQRSPAKKEDPPPIPRKSLSSRSSMSSAPPVPQTPSSQQQQSYQFHDDEDVYSFDSLDPPATAPSPKPTPAKKPEVPMPYNIKKRPSSSSVSPITRPVRPKSPEKPALQMFDDEDVYAFDNLEPASSQQQEKSVSGSSPDLGQPPGDQSDQVYFDHLVTGQRPAPPTKPPPVYGGGGAGKPPTGPPTIPPKSSPPLVKKKGEGKSVSHDEKQSHAYCLVVPPCKAVGSIEISE